MSIAPSASNEPPPPAASTAAATPTAAATSATPVATSAASVAASAASVAAAGVVAAVAVAAVSDKLYVGPGCPDVFLVEDIERRQGNVGNFLLTKSDFLALSGVPGRHVGWLSCGYRRCAARQRQGQPGGPQQGHGAGSTLPLRSLLRVRHGGILPCV